MSDLVILSQLELCARGTKPMEAILVVLAALMVLRIAQARCYRIQLISYLDSLATMLGELFDEE